VVSATIPPQSLIFGFLDRILGATLFNIYINNIPSVGNDCNVPTSVYADDMDICVRSESRDIAVRKLNAPIGILEPWLRKWGIRINAITLFSKRLRNYRRSRLPVKIFNENIAWTNETKYLGFHLIQS
jgi:hypothetical protein